MRFAAPVTSAQRPSRSNCRRNPSPRRSRAVPRALRLHYRHADDFPRRMPTALPAPSDEALQVSAALAAEIRAARSTSRGGWLDFARYMELALYAPGLGYYSAGSTKLGAAGDFVTAPELSSVLGARARGDARRRARALRARTVLELGAGSGALAAQLLDGVREARPRRALRDPRAERRLARAAAPCACALRGSRALARTPSRTPFAGVVSRTKCSTRCRSCGS